MKYVITGSLGHISKPIALALIKAGHETVIITSNNDRVKDIEAIGAKAAVGSVEDSLFTSNVFSGADVVYLMIPPNYTAPDLRAFQNKVADVYFSAVKKNNIKYVVVLSSIGAHLGNGAGPVDGLADLEKKFSELKQVNIIYLRPSYFFINLLGMIPLIKNANIMGSNFGNSEEKLVLTDTGDIAEAAIEELLKLNFTGHSIRYIASDERHPAEIAETLSKAINKPGIRWVSFTDEQALAGMEQAGLPPSLSSAYAIMGKAIREGDMQNDYWKKHPSKLGKVKLEDFAKQFAAAYNNN
jgi:uncharacterized protein YbjT (DUF2867 family)